MSNTNAVPKHIVVHDSIAVHRVQQCMLDDGFTNRPLGDDSGGEGRNKAQRGKRLKLHCFFL